jgi:hypothetical protein
MFKRRKKTIPPEELDILEAQLAGTLRPVEPSMDMVNRVRERIRMPAREELVFRMRDWGSLVFVFSGVMTGMLLIITIARAFFYLTIRRHTG